MSPLMHRGACLDRQRGAIGLLAALTMALALLCTLVVVDSGRLYLEKRTLQRVADMAALEAANLKGTCVGANSASAYATQSATRNGFSVTDGTRTLTTRCGTLAIGADSRRSFTADASKSDAIQVIVSHTAPRSIAAGIGAMFDNDPTPADIRLTAVAVATPPLPPLAQLSIRSSLLSVNIDDTKAGSLSTGISKLLGANIQLDAVSWAGLVDSDVNLLKFADQLALALNVKAGDYTQLLATNASVSTLLGASIAALQQGGNSASVQAAIKGLSTLQATVKGSPAGSALLKLGDLVNVQTGTPSAGLDMGLQAFELVQTIAQLANGKNAAVVSQTLSLLGAVTVTTKIKLVEPPQLSAIGNPFLAKAAPSGPNQIYVRTAQARALVSIKLPALTGVTNLVSAVLSVASPITDTLNGVLHLDLSAVFCLLGKKCTQTDPQVLPDGPTIDLGLELAASSGRVTDVNCTTDASKTLTAQVTTAVATVKAGIIDENAFFSTSTPAKVSPLAIVDIGTKACSNILLLFVGCEPRKPYALGGLGLTLDTAGVGNALPINYVFPQPPELNRTPLTKAFSNTNLIASIKNTLGGVTINQFGPNVASNGLGALLATAAGVFNGVTKAIGDQLVVTLGAALDPLINNLLSNLGVEIANVNVGANLSCHPGQAVLVI